MNLDSSATGPSTPSFGGTTIDLANGNDGVISAPILVGTAVPPCTVETCICERDGDPAQVDVNDLLNYLAAWFELEESANLNDDTEVDVVDLLTFLDCWFIAMSSDC